jgi:Putative MetA-pathway of phenol degradation
MRKILFLVLLTCLAPAWLRAQSQDPELKTDRPSITQSPFVVPRGTLQLETGLQYQQSRTGSLRTREYLYPEVLLRMGILEWAELRLHADYKKEHQVQKGFGPEQPAPDEKGIEQVQVGTKINLYRGGGAIPAIGFLGQVTFPVGNRDFRPPHAAPEGWLLFENELSEQVELDYSVGYRKRKDQEEYRGEAIYTVAGNVKLTEKVTVFAEFFGFKAPAASPENSVDAGLAVKLRPNLQVDLIGGAGLSQEAPQWFAGTGLTWRIPR